MIWALPWLPWGALCPLAFQIQRRTGHHQAFTGSSYPHMGGKAFDSRHQEDSSSRFGSSGVPNISESFFKKEMMVSALSNCLRNILFSRSNCLTFPARGLTGFAFLPRFFGARASNCPSSLGLRHIPRGEEYRPPRLSKAPMAPERPLHASACSRSFFLYCELNRLLWAFSRTSGSSVLVPDNDTGPEVRIGGSLRSGSLRCPPLRDPPLIFATSCSVATSARYTNPVYISSAYLSRPHPSTVIYPRPSVQPL